mgnify:FL=1
MLGISMEVELQLDDGNISITTSLFSAKLHIFLYYIVTLTRSQCSGLLNICYLKTNVSKSSITRLYFNH